MAGPVKTEAVVLRSMRYGEADRILHVYTPHRGRISAIAKGVGARAAASEAVWSRSSACGWTCTRGAASC